MFFQLEQILTTLRFFVLTDIYWCHALRKVAEKSKGNIGCGFSGEEQSDPFYWWMTIEHWRYRDIIGLISCSFSTAAPSCFHVRNDMSSYSELFVTYR